jgi:hypothetical protein
VCVVTGSALKQPAELTGAVIRPMTEVHAADTSQILQVLDGI